MNLRQSHVLVSQPLLKIQGANLKLKNPRFIANISPGIFRAIQILSFDRNWCKSSESVHLHFMYLDAM